MIIELLNGTVFDIDDYNLKRLFHFIPSAVIDHTSETVEGRPDIILSSQLNNRVIRVEFLYEAADIYDYYLLRDELNDLFMRTEPFYITFKREPYKRWLVKTSSQFEVPPAPHMNSFFVEFITMNGYSESTFTTDVKKEWDVDKWAWNGQIDWDSEFGYTFNSNSFNVYNYGNVQINPAYNDLRITIKATATSMLQIKNNTTGDVYIFNDSLSSTDTLILDGVRTLKNGVSSFGKTNKKILNLAVGANDFVVTGGSIQSIVFDFRFLYK